MRFSLEKVQTIMLLLFTAVIAVLYLFVSITYSPVSPSYQYLALANAFLHGQFHLIPPITDVGDYSLFHGKYYIYFGPLPVVFFLPLVFLFGTHVSQLWLAYLSSTVAWIFLYKLTKQLGITKKSAAVWLTNFFIFGTVFAFLATANITAYTIQVVGVTFVLIALYTFFKENFFLAGFFLACAGMTRPTLYLAVLFFVLEIFKLPVWHKKMLLFFLPIVVSIFIFGEYNFVRFGSVLETGYHFIVNTEPAYISARVYGDFSIVHIPGNLYFLLLKGPDPVQTTPINYVLGFPYIRVNEWGLGIFFTSPLFLYLWTVNLRAKYVGSALASTAVSLFPILMYYSSGLWQYGYRYAMDFYPFLFIMLVTVFKDHLPIRAKILIVYSICFGLLFMYSIWHIYPFKT